MITIVLKILVMKFGCGYCLNEAIIQGMFFWVSYSRAAAFRERPLMAYIQQLFYLGTNENLHYRS